MDAATASLDQIRRHLALAVGENAVFDGWNEAAVDSAAATHQIDPAIARLAFPREPAAMIGAYVEGVDAALAAKFPAVALEMQRIPERIRTLVLARLELMVPAREAVRRALAILAMPHHLPTAARLGWRSADRMWRLAGDTSNDFNHYSKRATLASIYAATLLVWLDDKSEHSVETHAFLDRRLAGVARLEKLKGQWRGSASRRPSLSRFLGRLRYPPR